ncbi:MAG: EAL domain-containing protein [Eubacterium sp.]|nr:EAL domain-containing protein [Eubacterium sp.]
MERIPYYDFSAFMIILVLLFAMFFRRMIHGRVNHTYLVLLIVLLATTVCDALSTSALSMIGDPDTKVGIRSIASFVYFALRIALGPIYIIFIGHLTGTWHKCRTYVSFMTLFLVPYFLCLMLLVINSFIKPIIFYYTPEGYYARGDLIILYYIIGIYYMIFSFVYLMWSKKYLGSTKFYTLLTLFPLTIIAMVIQYLKPVYLLEMFGYAIFSMLISNIVLRPEEYLDPITKARSYLSFKNDLPKFYRSGVHASLILIKIKNFDGLMTLLGSEKTMRLEQEVVNVIQNVESPLKRSIFHPVYNMRNGLFIVLADGVQREEFIYSESRRIFSRLQGTHHSSHLDLDLDISVCTIRIPEDIDNYKELISFANTFHQITSDTEVAVFSRVAPEKQFQMKNNIDEIITRGIVNKSFVMYYQPIYSVKERRFTSAEALIRLFDEKNGMVSPAIFIPSAEKSGAIHQIGEFVVQDVCRFISKQNMVVLGLNYVEINLSVVQCMRNNTVDKIESLLTDNHVDPKYVNFEITETATEFVHETLRSNVLALHDHGLEFSLDDYGTGYSNLQRMVDFPFKLIKLDKSFVDQWEDPRMRTVIQNTIRMLKDIGKEIVVEGVETKEEAEWFVEQKCDYIQGYYYAKPMPEEEFLAFLKKHRLPIS